MGWGVLGFWVLGFRISSLARTKEPLVQESMGSLGCPNKVWGSGFLEV